MEDLEEGYTVILTSDRATMTDYSGVDFIGFILCLPYRLLPKPLIYKFIAPPIKTDRRGKALIAPYPLRKLEAALISEGFSREEVAIIPPERLHEFVRADTKVIGIHVLDPLGKAPVPYTLRSYFGGGDSCTKLLFLRLIDKLRKLKERFRFKLIAGGPGSWQLKEEYRRYGIDCLVHGEGELLFPELCRKVIEGEDIGGEYDGGSAPVDRIPNILGPSRSSLVQITRGCPRRCAFCNPTMFDFRSIPLENIFREIEVNKRAGFSHIGLVTEDGFAYGAKGIEVNKQAVSTLIRSIKDMEVTAGFCHVSISSILQAPDIVKEYSESFGYDRDNPYLPQIGVETGSPRLIARYMAGKSRPWTPKDWPWMVLEATQIANDNAWYPCYTLIVGLPGEEEEDIIKTLELIDELRDSKCWIFPLLFIPMGRSIMERESWRIMWEIFKEAHWELLTRCLEHNLKFSQEIIDKMMSKIPNPIARKVFERFFKYSISSLWDLLPSFKKNPMKLIKDASRLDVYSEADFLKELIHFAVLRMKEKIIIHR